MISQKPKTLEGFWTSILDPHYGFNAGFFVLDCLMYGEEGSNDQNRVKLLLLFCFVMKAALHYWPKKMPKRPKSQQTRCGLPSHCPSFTDKKNNWSTKASFILIEEFAGLCLQYNMNHISTNVDIEDLRNWDNSKIQVLTHNLHFLGLSPSDPN